MEGTKRSPWIWIVLSVIALFFLVIALFGFAGYFAVKHSSNNLGDGDIALVHIDGIISAGRTSSGLLGMTGRSSEDTVKLLDKISRIPHYRAIVLRVNSPGGTAAASQEIYEKLMQIRKNTGIKIVVSMGDVAASGAYYISSTADKIYAEPATLTGSIGVIAELMDLQGLYKKLGIVPETMKAGQFKDLGNQSRPMTKAEKKIFQDILDEAHSEFIDDVATGRNLPVDDVRALADGRVYTGKQALALHLIDGLGNLEDAEDEAARLAGITGTYKVFDVDHKTFMEQLLGGGTDTETLFPQSGLRSSGLYFLLKILPAINESSF